MPVLIEPTTSLHTAWLEAHAEWGPGLHEDGFSLQESAPSAQPAPTA